MALQWPPLKFSCFLEPHIQHNQADFSEAVTWAPRRRGKKSEVSPGTQGPLRDGAWGKTRALLAAVSHPGPGHWRPTRDFPLWPCREMRQMICRSGYCSAGLLEEQLLTCLLAVAQNMFVLPAASPPSMGKESGICICAPRPFIPLPTHRLQGQQVSVKVGNSHQTVCPQASFFFSFLDTIRAESNGVHYP